MNAPTILVIDDDDALTESLAMALEDEGYRVCTAQNGAEAIRHLNAEDPPACILLDLMMPVMSGFQLHHRLAEDERLAKIPTVVLTAGQIDQRVQEMNVVGWFRKPFSIEALLATLEIQLAANGTPKNKPLGGRTIETGSSLEVIEKRLATEPAHVIHLYESERALAELIGGYLAAGASAGDAFVVVATPGHRTRFREEMAARGVEPNALDPRTAVWLDADAMLARFMRSDRPNPNRFESTMAPILESAASFSRSGRIRVYGEAVNVLWRQGNLAGALELEKLWNMLAKGRGFSLICAYDLAGRDPYAKARLRPHCEEHTLMFGSEHLAASNSGSG